MLYHWGVASIDLAAVPLDRGTHSALPDRNGVNPIIRFLYMAT